jgi:hypothetical protein
MNLIQESCRPTTSSRKNKAGSKVSTRNLIYIKDPNEIAGAFKKRGDLSIILSVLFIHQTNVPTGIKQQMIMSGY